MSKYRLLYLDFGTSAIHHSTSRFAGSQELSGGLPENDTIISAAAVAWLQVTGEFPKWFEQPEVYNVASSSLLPVYNNYLYLPVPPKIFRVKDDQRHQNKKAKKIHWLEKDEWLKWATTTNYSLLLESDNPDEAKKDSKSDEKKNYLVLDEKKWVKETVVDRVALHPKHTIDNETKKDKLSVPYRVKLHYFQFNTDKEKNYSKAALILPENITEEFIKALIVLGKLGLGGDRTYGYGQFTVEEQTPIEFDDTIANSRINLGLLYPTEDIKKELKSSPIWSIVTRQGRNHVPGTSIPIVTKAVNMINRGALLHPSCGPVAGGTVNVFPDSFDEKIANISLKNRTIYRSGRTICLPTVHNLNDVRCTVEYV